MLSQAVSILAQRSSSFRGKVQGNFRATMAQEFLTGLASGNFM